jgi:hypothetical protein
MTFPWDGTLQFENLLLALMPQQLLQSMVDECATCFEAGHFLTVAYEFVVEDNVRSAHLNYLRSIHIIL